MKLIPRKGIRLGIVAGLVATGLVGVTSLTASGAPTQSAGTIIVDAVAPPDSTGKLLATVEHRDAGGNLVGTQTISANGPCDTLVNAGDRILSLSTTPPDSRPVLVNDGLGVLSGNQNCGAEGVIDRTEALILKLGDYFKNTALFDTDVYVLETKLEVLRSGSPVRLAVTRDNNEVEERTVAQRIVEEETFGRWDERLVVSSTANRFNRGIVLVNATFELQRKVANQAPTASFTWDATTLTVDFDETSSDPDGTVVAWEWKFGDDNTKTINRVTGSVESGDTSHTYDEDGSYPVTLTVTDDLGQTSTVFTALVTVEGTAVFCSEPVTASGNAATATFLRGENGDKFMDPCADVGVIVEFGTDPAVGDYVFWDNSFTGVDGTPQDVNGLVTVTWLEIDPADQAEVARMNTREIDYTGLEDGIQRKPQSYCLEFEQTVIPGATPEEDTYVFEAVLPDWPEGDDDPGFILVGGDKKVPWCLVSDTRVVDEFGNITQTEVLYGRGDPAKFK